MEGDSIAFCRSLFKKKLPRGLRESVTCADRLPWTGPGAACFFSIKS